MLISGIRLSNFLPFKGNHAISFSLDPMKNVTIIMGENGAGKTSLAQAFEWCLYAKTSYKDNNLLNFEVRENLKPGNFALVEVEVCLDQDGRKYFITRKQRYEKSLAGGPVEPGKVDFSITYTTGDGQTYEVAAEDQQATIDELLASKLSKYFFFDGEHVKDMRNELESGRSSDFADAVRSMLGLGYIANTLEHLKPESTSKHSVYRDFSKQFDSNGDKKISKKEEEVATKERAIKRLTAKNEELQAESDSLAKEIAKHEKWLQDNEESEQAITQKKRAANQLSVNKSALKASEQDIFTAFKKYQYRYFIDRLLHDAQETLSDEEKIDKGVPSVRDETIHFLLDRHRCICGTELVEGSSQVHALEELLKFVPPQSIGSAISEFNSKCSLEQSHVNELSEEIDKKYEHYCNCKDSVSKSEKSLKSAVDYLASINNVDVKSIRKIYNDAVTDKDRCDGDILRNQSTIRSEKAAIAKLNDEILQLAGKSEKNAEIVKCMTYTSELHRYFKQYYDSQEKKVRVRLEDEVNRIFKQIYDGELYLEFDDNYTVTVKKPGITLHKEKWKTSSAQTLAVILSFIAGILELSRENKNSEEDLAQGDTYPLVMDAPLSDFDTERIKNICEVLPVVAEQVIIIIKDTDGTLAEENLNSRIGRRYRIIKQSDTSSEFKER